MELAAALTVGGLLVLWLTMVWLDARETRRRVDEITHIPAYWLLKRSTAQEAVANADLSGDLITLAQGVLKGAVRAWEKEHGTG